MSPPTSWRWSDLPASKTTIHRRSAAGCASVPGWRVPWRSIPRCYFFDEPSAGLDPLTSKLLDDLVLELRDSLGATIVMVTHELPQIFATADNCVFLDPETKTQIASGDPKMLVRHAEKQKVREFLTRGGTAAHD